MPQRAHHLSNDAQNIDDVQVAFGRALAEYREADTVWVVDAGVSRFFGHAFVVDTLGLNTPQMLGPGAQAYLDLHPPKLLDVFPGWSRIETDAHAPRLPVRAFETTTPYSVTSMQSMRMHFLFTCAPQGLLGRFFVRSRSFGFRCAS
jgi:hypothetical protein